MKFRLTHEDGVPTTQDRFAHIVSMIEGIEQILVQRGAELHEEHRLLAIERMFEIIGVAASHIPTEIKQTASDVDWAMIANLDARLADPLVRVDEATLLDAASRIGPLKAFAARMSS